MVKKKQAAISRKGVAQGKESQETKVLTPEQVEEYLCSQDSAIMECYYTRELSAEDTIAALSLKGVTAEQVRDYTCKRITLGTLFDMRTTETGEIAHETGLPIDKVNAVLTPVSETIDALKEQQATEEETARKLRLTLEDLTDLLAIIEETAQRREVIRHFLGEWDAEETAQKFSLTEEQVRDMIDAFKEKTFALSAEGKTIEEIGSILNYEPLCIVDTLGDKREEIRTLQAVSMQTFMREHRVGHRDRIERLTALRDILIAEIQERGLKEVPAEKLVTLFLKTEDSLRQEERQTPVIAHSRKSNLWHDIELPLV